MEVTSAAFSCGLPCPGHGHLVQPGADLPDLLVNLVHLGGVRGQAAVAGSGPGRFRLAGLGLWPCRLGFLVSSGAVLGDLGVGDRAGAGRGFGAGLPVGLDPRGLLGAPPGRLGRVRCGVLAAAGPMRRRSRRR